MNFVLNNEIDNLMYKPAGYSLWAVTKYLGDLLCPSIESSPANM